MSRSSPRRAMPCVIAVLLAASATSSAGAACGDLCDDLPEGTVCPDPAQVVMPFCVRASPDGSMSLEIEVIGTDGMPLGDATVEMIFSADCGELIWCETGLPPTVLTAVTDASGTAVFAPRVGGTCVATSAVRIVSYGCEIGRYDSLASPDVDGDGHVTLPDFVRFQMSFLTADPRFELARCDDIVSLPDFVEFQQRFLVECP